MLKKLFTRNWVSKVMSLLIAIAIWFTIFSHLSKKSDGPPVPGTDGTKEQIAIPKLPSDTATTPPLNPLAPPAVIPGN
jgi:hypothetical protein